MTTQQKAPLLYPYQTLSSHTHQTPIAISPLSNTLYSPSQYSFSRFSLPRLTLVGKGPELSLSGAGAAVQEDAASPITMLQVKEPKRGQELAYVAVNHVLFVITGNIILRRLVFREPIVSFCWIGQLLCVLGKGYVTLVDEGAVKAEQMATKMETDEDQEDLMNAFASVADDDSHESNDSTYYTSYISRVALPQDSTPSQIVHIPTYVNKVLISTEEGHIDLINITTGKLLFRYGPFEREETGALAGLDRNLHLLQERRDANQSKHASISCMVPVPEVLDIVALGLSDGQIVLLDVYTNEILITFNHAPGPVNSISFRQDGVPTMVSGTATGSIAVWNLESGKLLETYPHAHMDSVISLTFIRGTSLMVSSGQDNAIKLWEFETPDKMSVAFTAEGHALPPSKLRFYGPSGRWLLSAGKDRQIRMTDIKSGTSRSFRHKQHTNTMIRGKKGKRRTTHAAASGGGDESKSEKMGALRPPVIDFDFSFMRERDWPNLVSAHSNDHTVSTWIIRDATMGKGAMWGRRFDASVTTITVSPCGNHVIIGRKDGSLEKWNLQSCLKKGTFSRSSTKQDKGAAEPNINPQAQSKKKKLSKDQTPAHDSAVNCVMIDNLNQYVFSAGFDGRLRVWDISSFELVHEHNFNIPISKIVRSRNSNMIALACADFSIKLLDSTSFKLIRNLKGHSFVVNDMAFSSDSRFLYSCGNDNYIIVWDIISADKVEWVELPRAATSIDVDSKDMYIVTSHAGSVGLAVWINKLTFGVGALRQVTHPVKMDLPAMGDSFHYDESNNALKKQNAEKLSYKFAEDEEEDNDILSDEEFHQLLQQLHQSNQKDLITQLGSDAEQKILSIRKLDALRERAKVFETTDVEALRKEIPFFIDTQANEKLETQFVTNEAIKAKLEGTAVPSSNGNGTAANPLNLDGDDDAANGEVIQSSIGVKLASPASSRMIQLIMDAHSNSVNAEDDSKSQSPDYSHVEEYLRNASAKAIDMSIRLLSAMDNYSEMIHFLRYMLHAIKKGIDFDLGQSVLNLFLQVHDEVIIGGNDNEELYGLLADIQRYQQDAWHKIDQSLKKNLFLCKHLSNLQ